jgi:hypothetical protein
MKSHAVRMVEIDLLRAVAREHLTYVVEAENTAPGGDPTASWYVMLAGREGGNIKAESHDAAQRIIEIAQREQSKLLARYDRAVAAASK